MQFLKTLLRSKTFWLSLTGIAVAGALIVALMNYIVMPMYTNYNEGITVPDVTKISLSEAEELLTSRGLRFEVMDRRANAAYPADYIIDQSPSARVLVKPNRKIYLTVNTAETPMTEVPDVVNMSYRNAEIQLRNHGLTVGTISYESSRFRNTIMRQSVAAGDTVARGTVVNLVVSDGLGTRMVDVPEVVGLSYSEAQRLILSSGLRVGEVRFQPDRETTPNTVLSARPVAEQLTEGTELQLVISERFDAREESETGAIVDDSTAVNPPGINPDGEEGNDNKQNER
ncbi:PASTA domain-containing protein [Rhodohalobacter mucosus]|uniref:PASTA domain-containing protein n=1 Tax=Rhodohalobacter mucosus TaxID=2079485 RepID=A0A316U1T3_9BACT|nr:PASTA domain-containing protein [Rhodohalobacter mucosus]PWN06986.1 PASTA domain-containing protein [Rhodohalobacter mucosus]